MAQYLVTLSTQHNPPGSRPLPVPLRHITSALAFTSVRPAAVHPFRPRARPLRFGVPIPHRPPPPSRRRRHCRIAGRTYAVKVAAGADTTSPLTRLSCHWQSVLYSCVPPLFFVRFCSMMLLGRKVGATRH
jgi:hypothetical protein